MQPFLLLLSSVLSVTASGERQATVTITFSATIVPTMAMDIQSTDLDRETAIVDVRVFEQGVGYVESSYLVQRSPLAMLVALQGVSGAPEVVFRTEGGGRVAVETTLGTRYAQITKRQAEQLIAARSVGPRALARRINRIYLSAAASACKSKYYRAVRLIAASTV